MIRRRPCPSVPAESTSRHRIAPQHLGLPVMPHINRLLESEELSAGPGRAISVLTERWPSRGQTVNKVLQV